MNIYDNANKDAIEIAHLASSNELDLKLVVTLGNKGKGLKQAGPTICTPQEFCDHVANGGVWEGAVREPSALGSGRIVGQQLFCLDFGYDYDLNRPMQPGDEDFLTPEDAYFRAVRLGLDLLCIHFLSPTELFNFSAYRLVFALKTMVDAPTARVFANILYEIYPEAILPHPDVNRRILRKKSMVLGPWLPWKDWL